MIGEGDDVDVLEVLDGIERLVDHSLLRQDAEAGEPRFSMFETIREFGLERLAEEGDGDQAHLRHAEWIRSLVLEYRLDMDREEFADWLRRIDREQDNLRSALAWAIDHAPAIAVGIAGGAGRFWQWRSHFREGHDWMERVLALDRSCVALDDLARTVRVSAIFLDAFGDAEESRRRSEHAMELYERSGDLAEVAFAKSVVANAELMRADHQAVFAQHLDAVALARAAGNPFVLAATLNNLAVTAIGAGIQFDAARDAMTEAFDLMRHHSGPTAATVVSTYADIVRMDGDLPGAKALYTRGLADGWPGGLAGIIMSNLMGLAMTEVAAERWIPAARLMGVIAAYMRVGDNELEPDTGNFQEEYQEYIARTRSALDAEAFQAAWAEGATTPLEEVVAELLAEEWVAHG